MARHVIGLDIGSSSVRAVEVKNPGSAHPVVLRSGEIALPPGASRYGEIVDPEAVATVLRYLWTNEGFRTKKVVLGIGGQRMIARDLTVPAMPLRRIRETLAFQVQDLLPVPVSDVLLDFYPTEEVANDSAAGEGVPMVAGLLIAVLKEVVRTNVRAVELAGLTALEVDILPFALTRALRGDLDSDDVIAIIEVGASATTVVVCKARVPQFVRIVPRGGADLTDRLADQLNIDPLRAEKVKLGLAVGFQDEEIPDYLVEAALIVENFQRDLLHGLRNTLGYYASTHSVPISRILLSGGGARMTGFASALEKLSGIPVERGALLASRARDGSVDDHTLAAAYGLALGSVQ